MKGPATTAGLKTPDELAAEWKCSRAAIYRWVESGRLKAVRVGVLLRFRTEDAEAFLKGEA